ncbi:hypothetical protein L596_026623 [Steinernema carpocapsae]|uniref:Uncharacterized protein n=1 Tax=Steinernema carpocapsae TaxID=34508 RepID=A0A4U5M1X3_STECR|nr:hypothetical protein L596_026623 [Steinernema carpocapsae]
MLSPVTGYKRTDKLFSSEPKYSLRLKETHAYKETYFTICCSCFSFLCYVAVVVKILRQKRRSQSVSRNIHEKAILIQAMIRFFVKLTIQMIYLIAATKGSAHANVTEVLTQVPEIGLLMNLMAVPIILYLVLNRYL